MDNNGSLGRGLEALIPKKTIVEAVDTTGVQQIPVGNISPNPRQPRQNFDEKALQELSDSVKRHGVLQPLVVTSLGGGNYELVAGERRLQASKIAGLESVPAIVRTVGEQEKLEIAIVENVQRHDLNPVEEAEAFVRLIEEFTLTQEEVAAKVSKSREYVSNTIRLLGLAALAKQALREGKITRGHAKAMLGLGTEDEQVAMLDRILSEGLSVRDVEGGGVRKRVEKREPGIGSVKDPELLGLEEELRGKFGTRVTIKGTRKSGEVIIDYYSSEEFDELIGKLGADEA